MKAPSRTRIALGLAMTLALGTVFAQAGKGPTQVVKPPVSQAWIDVATFAGMGMPSMGGGGGSPMSMMGSMFGGGPGRQEHVWHDSDRFGRPLGRRDAVHQP